MTRTLYLIVGLSIGFTLGFIAGHSYYIHTRDKHARFMREHIRLLREKLNSRGKLEVVEYINAHSEEKK